MAVKRIKPLKPHLKERKRYLVFEAISEKPLDGVQAHQAVWQESLAYLGERGAADAGLQILEDKWLPDKQRGVVRINHTMVDHMRAALLFTRAQDGVLFRTRGISGVLKKAQEKYLNS